MFILNSTVNLKQISMIDNLLIIYHKFNEIFWNENVWLPANTTWATYRNCENGINYAQFNDLYYSLVTALVFLCLRFALEKYLFTPFGIFLGIKHHHSRIKSNPLQESNQKATLEKFFNSNGKIGNKQLKGLSKKFDIDEKKLGRWLRWKNFQVKHSLMSKFTESAWRCTFYFSAFLYGIWALHDKPWTYDSAFCFINYPHHSISNEVWWYYNFELGFYISLIFSQFFDVKRKDFWQMFIHHIVTVCLLCFSWGCNLHRIGTLVLIIHDFADIPLEGSKIANYIKKPKLANVVFTLFTICWIYSRLGLLPFRVILYSTYYGLDYVEMFPAYYIFNSLLIALQILHIIWTLLILKIAYNAFFKDGVKDLRESDESSSSLDEISTNEDSCEVKKLS